MPESHFPWVTSLRSQLKRLSLSCTSEDYKKLLKKFESSVSAEVIKLKSKPKRSTKFSHILKSLISSLKLIQYAADVKNDESILSALGLIATHYVHLIQSSSLLDREAPSEMANNLYSFVQVVLEPSREFILDAVLAVGEDTISDANPVTIQLFKNVLEDKSKYQNDSKTFFKFLTLLKLLMEGKIAEKKIRKILLETAYPKDFPAYLREKLLMKVKTDDIDLPAVLSKIKPEVVIGECKSRLSIRGLEKSEDNQSSHLEFMDSTSLFFIDAGNNEIQNKVSSDMDVTEGFNLHSQSGIESTATTMKASKPKDAGANAEESPTNSVYEQQAESPSLESNDERDELNNSALSDDNDSTNFVNGDNSSEFSEDESKNIENAVEHCNDTYDTKGRFDGDGVDFDENHENAVVTDPESDEEIPLLELDSDFDGDAFANMNTSAEEHSELMQEKDNIVYGDLELASDNGNSDVESTSSDDTVQLNVTRIRKNAEKLKTEEDSGSASDNQNDQADLQLPSHVRDENDDSLSSTDTVEISSTRERPSSSSPELGKATSLNKAGKPGDTSASTESVTAKSNAKAVDEISPRRRRASSRQGVTTPLQNVKQAPVRRTRAKAQPVEALKKGHYDVKTRASPRRATPKVEAAKAVDKSSKTETESKSSTDKGKIPDRSASNNSTISPTRRSSVKKTTPEKQIRTRNARNGRKSALHDAPPKAPAPDLQLPVVDTDSFNSNTAIENRNKLSELPPAEINRRVTRSSRADSSSPAKVLPIAKRTRNVYGSTAVRSTPKKAKVGLNIEPVILESAEGEERQEKATDTHADANTKPIQSTSASASTGERYNLRRRSTYKN